LKDQRNWKFINCVNFIEVSSIQFELLPELADDSGKLSVSVKRF
jgi:hypothetical protein